MSTGALRAAIARLLVAALLLELSGARLWAANLDAPRPVSRVALPVVAPAVPPPAIPAALPGLVAAAAEPSAAAAVAAPASAASALAGMSAAAQDLGASGREAGSAEQWRGAAGRPWTGARAASSAVVAAPAPAKRKSGLGSWRSRPASLSVLFFYSGPLALIAGVSIPLKSGKPGYDDLGNTTFPLTMVAATIVVAGAFWLLRLYRYPSMSLPARRAFVATFTALRWATVAALVGGVALIAAAGPRSHDWFFSSVMLGWGVVEVTHHFLFQILPQGQADGKWGWHWRGGTVGRQLRKMRAHLRRESAG